MSANDFQVDSILFCEGGRLGQAFSCGYKRASNQNLKSGRPLLFLPEVVGEKFYEKFYPLF